MLWLLLLAASCPSLSGARPSLASPRLRRLGARLVSRGMGSLSGPKCRRPDMRVRHGDLAGKFDKNSFVQNDMRKAAMKLHTKDQSKEGEQEERKPLSQWEMSRTSVLRFLVDSKVVHSALDELASKNPELKAIDEVSEGIKRCDAIERDIKAILDADPKLQLPNPGDQALGYAKQLHALAEESVPAFVCHYYNTHFAHAAGGRMIGKLIADKHFGGETMEFYKYPDGKNPKELLESVRQEIDNLANTWDQSQRQSCLDETANAFKGAGTVLQNLK